MISSGTKFWKKSSKAGICQYYDETGVKDANSCDRALNAICEKPASQIGTLYFAVAYTVVYRKGCFHQVDLQFKEQLCIHSTC